MALNIAPLLIHSDAVPGPAREALRAASSAPPESRGQALESAARLLHSQTDLDCSDIRELVGLPARSAAAADTTVGLPARSAAAADTTVGLPARSAAAADTTVGLPARSAAAADTTVGLPARSAAAAGCA